MCSFYAFIFEFMLLEKDFGWPYYQQYVGNWLKAFISENISFLAPSDKRQRSQYFFFCSAKLLLQWVHISRLF
jgi:hypothetical protein